jgi:hypothetical protein
MLETLSEIQAFTSVFMPASGTKHELIIGVVPKRNGIQAFCAVRAIILRMGFVFGDKGRAVIARFETGLEVLKGFYFSLFSGLFSGIPRFLAFAFFGNRLRFLRGDHIISGRSFRIKSFLSVSLPLALFLGVFLCQARGMGDNPVFLGGDPACLDAGKEMTEPPAADCPCKQAKDKVLDVLRKIGDVCHQRGDQDGSEAGNDLDDSRGHLVTLLVGLLLGAFVGYFANAAYQTFSSIDCKPETPKSKNEKLDNKE